MHHQGPRPRARFPEEYGGYLLHRYAGCVFAVPPHLDPEALEQDDALEMWPGVLCGASLGEVQALVDAVASTPPDVDEGADPTGWPVEFAGWLPAFRDTANCGRHPQFNHTKCPPAGYHFTRSMPPGFDQGPGKPSFLARMWAALKGAAKNALAGLRLLGEPFRSAPGAGLGGRWRVFSAMASLFWKCWSAGAGPWPTLEFLHSRGLHSQMLLANHPGPVFLTSMPYTYGQWPWLVEIEDPTTLFYPHVQNGHTYEMDMRPSPYFPAVKALLEDDACKGIVTHMRSTAELVSALFRSDAISAKITHGPMGVALPERFQRHEEDDGKSPIEMLFINSWHQMPGNFNLRGGLDVLEAFEQIRHRFPRLRLTLRTRLPPLASRYRRTIEEGRVRVIGRFLPAEEMAELHAASHIFLLPAARIHIVSLLQAMSYGLAVVASNGWGFDEYLENGHNGLMVPGRYGVTSWADHEAGMLREDYDSMRLPNPKVVAGLVSALSRLAESHELRARLGRTAREDVRTRYTLARWNEALGSALDRASGRRKASGGRKPADRGALVGR
jgi:glycosyltransferase involved in cell wall biosynthesis